MRRAAALLFRFLASLAGSAVIVVPIALMIVLAAVYLVDVFHTLIAPGVSVEYHYDSPAGRMKVAADSFSIDPWNLRATVHEAAISTPSGQPVLRIGRIDAAFLNPAWQVSALGGRIWLERRRTGKFDIEDYLPPQTGKPSEIPVQVSVDRIEVFYRDRKGKGDLVEHALLRQVSYSGSGPTGVASAKLSIDSFGTAPIAFRIDPGGRGSLEASLRDGRVAPVIAHLERWIDTSFFRDYAPLDAGSLTATGPLRISWNKDRPINLWADLVASGAGISVSDYVRSGSASLNVRFRDDRMSGLIDLKEPGRSAKFDGWIGFGDKFGLSGKLQASAQGTNALWTPLKKLLPKELSVGASKFDGNVAWQADRYRVSGKLEAGPAKYARESTPKSVWTVNLDDDAVTGSSTAVSYLGQTAQAAIRYDLKSKQLSGYVESSKIQFADIAKKFGIENLKGEGSIRAVLSGDMDQPKVVVESQGAAAYKQPDGRWLYLGLFQGRALVGKTLASIQRFAISGPNGTATLAGSYGLKNGVLDFQARAGGVNLGAFSPDVEGVGFLEASINGTKDKPSANGTMKAFSGNVMGQDISAAETRFALAENRLALTELKGIVGTGALDGDFAFNTKSKAIEGNFSLQKYQISDLLPDTIGGFGSIQSGKVSGTLDAPEITGEAILPEFAVDGVRISGATASIHADRKKIEATNIRGNVPGGDNLAIGSITASATYTFDSKSGRINALLTDIPLEPFSASIPEVSLGGRSSGVIDLEFHSDRIDRGRADLRMQQVVVNGALIGDGKAEAVVADSAWTGSAQIGDLDRYILIKPFAYDSKTEALDATVEALNIRVEDIVAGLKKTIANWPESIQRLAYDLKSNASLLARISGNAKSPDATIDSLSLSQISLGGRSLGELSASAKRIGTTWDIKQLRWLGPETFLSASGTVEENGVITADVDMPTFDLSILSSIDPTWPRLFGSIGFSASISGETRSPILDGTLQAKEVGFVSGENEQVKLPLSLLIDQLHLENRKLTASGTFNLDEFAGSMNMNADIDALLPQKPDTGPAVGNVHAKLELADREFKDIQAGQDWIDGKKSSGRVGGYLQIDRENGEFKYAGQLFAKGDLLAAKDFDMSLKDFSSTLTLNGNTATLEIEGDNSQGGWINALAKAQLPELFGSGKSIREQLAASQLSGFAALNGLQIVQIGGKKDFSIYGTADGLLTLGGTLLEPSITGRIGAGSTSIYLPEAFAESAPRAVPYINPRFDIKFETDSPLHIKTSNSDFNSYNIDIWMNGSGQVGGSWQYPDVRAEMLVNKGTFNLPLSRIRLDEGGTIRLGYSAAPRVEAVASLNVDVVGKTRLVAPKTTGQYEVYDVTLEFTGDLLREGGINVRATSEPTGLSQDQIMATLGQVGLIGNIAKGEFKSTANQFVGVLLPSVINRQFGRLAESIKLDYLNIDYSPTGSILLSGAKSLGKNLLLQLSRELTTPANQVPKYEVKLTYRVPVRDRILGRIRVGIGFDQSAPWKVSLDYGTRLWGFQLTRPKSRAEQWQRIWP